MRAIKKLYTHTAWHVGAFRYPTSFCAHNDKHAFWAGWITNNDTVYDPVATLMCINIIWQYITVSNTQGNLLL